MTAAQTALARPYVTIDRRELLRSVKAGRVYRSLSGFAVQMAPAGRNNRRVTTRVREAIAIGWVTEPAPGTRLYRITSDGERDLAERERATTGGAS